MLSTSLKRYATFPLPPPLHYPAQGHGLVLTGSVGLLSDALESFVNLAER